jgi:ankyrin repeat protein
MKFEEAHSCIKRGDIGSLIRSLDSGLDPNLSNQFSWTLLMLAAIQGNTAIGRALVSHGANVDATNNFGECALSLAAHKGHITFASWLLDAGANRECRSHGSDLSDWIEQTSGLPPEKISAVLQLLRDHRLFH